MVERQKRELREWEKAAIKKKHEFLDANRGQGKVIRDYVRDDRLKHDGFRKAQIEARKKRREEQEKERVALKATQDANLDVFKAYLKQGLRPPEALWPGNKTAATVVPSPLKNRGGLPL